MSKQLQIGTSIFEYPENNQNPGWGEVATDWAEAATDVIADLSGPNDVLLTTALIANTQPTAQNVVGLSFNIGSVKSFSAPYFVTRSVTGTTVVESGTMNGNYDGTAWNFSVVDVIGDGGMDFDITSAGQVTYYSDTLAGTSYVGQIKFRAKTIDT